MVEERATERALEEVVGDDVVRGALAVQVLVDGKGRRLVPAHRQADRVRTGDVAVLLAAVDLVLLLVEAVHEVAGTAAGLARTLEHAVRREDARGGAGLVRRCDVVVDGEPLVREVACGNAVGRVGARRRQGRGRGEVHVVLQEALVRGAVLRDLGRRRGGRVLQAVDHLATDATPVAVEVVERVVLLVDDDEVRIARGELTRRLLRRRRRAGRRRRGDHEGGRTGEEGRRDDDGGGTGPGEGSGHGCWFRPAPTARPGPGSGCRGHHRGPCHRRVTNRTLTANSGRTPRNGSPRTAV